ncbi:MAG: FCD domain-containing protein [Hyphomicrobiaceae bacterium]
MLTKSTSCGVGFNLIDGCNCDQRGGLQNPFAEHEAIVKAIIDGDGETAARAFRRHVSIQGHRFADWVASLETT